MSVNGNGNGAGDPAGAEPHQGPRWYLVLQPGQKALYDLLQARLAGSEVAVILDRRQRERRRGSFGPTMERRAVDRRRQRPIGMVAAAGAAAPLVAPIPAGGRAVDAEAGRQPSTTASQRCPTCSVILEMELPRFPHPPARVDLEIGHVGTNGSDIQHYAEIAAFTVSGRILLSQRLPARSQR